MVEIRIVDILAYSTEDPKYPARDLMFGKKWLTAKNFRGTMNEVTLKLEKCTVISAVDIGNCGTAIVTVEVSRTGLKDFYTLITAFNLMTRQESMQGKNQTGVKIFTKEDMCEDIRDDQWDCVRVICTQPFKFDPFGLSFIRIFSYSDSPVVESSTPTSPKIDGFLKRVNTTSKNDSLSRSERLLLEATSGRTSSPLRQHRSETKKSKRGNQDTQNDHFSKTNSRGARVKQSLFGRPDSLSVEHVPEASKVTKQKSNSTCGVLQNTSRKKHKKHGEMSNGSLLNWLTDNSIKDSSQANSNGPSTSCVKPNSSLHFPTQEEKLNAGAGKESEDDDSDNTVLNVPSSPDSNSSQITLNIIRSSSEEREVQWENFSSEETSFQKERDKNCGTSSEKSVFNEKVKVKQDIILKIPATHRRPVENREKFSKKSYSELEVIDIEDGLPGKRPIKNPQELGRLNIKKKTAARSVHLPEGDTIEISDSESNNSDDTVTIVKPNPEKNYKKRRISPPKIKKKSKVVWLCSEGEDLARKPSTTKKTLLVSCPLCSKKFPVSDIEAHAGRCEPILEETSEGGGEGTAKCPVCQRFVPQEVLVQHVNACLDAP